MTRERDLVFFSLGSLRKISRKPKGLSPNVAFIYTKKILNKNDCMTHVIIMPTFFQALDIAQPKNKQKKEKKEEIK